MTEVCSAGFPHSDIRGSMDICSSPRLFAAYHVFLRLLVPRHPPCALLSLTFALIALNRYCSVFVNHGLLTLCSVTTFERFNFSIVCVRVWKFGLMSLHLDLSILMQLVSQYAVFKVHRCASCFHEANGDGEIRTLDPLLARQVLSQLSYTPIGFHLMIRTSCHSFSIISFF